MLYLRNIYNPVEILGGGTIVLNRSSLCTLLRIIDVHFNRNTSYKGGVL